MPRVCTYVDGGAGKSASRTAEAATGRHKFGVNKTNANAWEGVIAYAPMYNRGLSGAEVTQMHNWFKANIGRSISLPEDRRHHDV